MGLHTELFSPTGITTSTRSVMAGLGFHNAHVAPSELRHTRIAVALGKTFVGAPAAGVTENLAGVFEHQRPPD